jgi:hypothetical protein
VEEKIKNSSRSGLHNKQTEENSEEKGNPLNRFGFSALTEKERNDQAIDLDSEILASKAANASKQTKQTSSTASRGAKNNRKIAVDKKRKSSRRSSLKDEESEDEEIDINLRKSSRAQATSEIAYVEADSDDEYAQKAFILPGSGSKDRSVKRKVAKKEVKSSKMAKGTSDNDQESDKESEKSHCGDFSDSDSDIKLIDSVDSESDSEESDDNDIDYKIQHILTR